jgi:hypothetical protein
MDRTMTKAPKASSTVEYLVTDIDPNADNDELMDQLNRTR